jgi:hypothetical protein
MNWRSMSWLSRRDDCTALDALLVETWETGAAAAGRALDLQAGTAALLATCRQRQAADTAGHAAPGVAQPVADRPGRRPPSRQVTARVIAATAAAAGLTAAALAATGTFGPGSPPPGYSRSVEAAAVITRVERALSSPGVANVLEYARTAYPPGSIVEPVITGLKPAREAGPGSPWAVSYTVSWSYQSTTEVSGFTATGQRVFDEEISSAARRTTITAVIYRDASFWRATIRALPVIAEGVSTAPPAARPSSSRFPCGPAMAAETYGWPAFIRYELGCGEYSADGQQQVDGIDAIRLIRANGLGALWINPVTYLPLRALLSFHRGLPPSRTDFRWLPSTAVSGALLTVSIPAGFRQVAPPPS